MSSSLSTFTTDEIALKWQETYASQGVNRELAAAGRIGIVRGFRLKASGANMAVTVEADAVWGDHAAIVRTSGGYAITVKRTGNFDLSLSAFASQTVVIAINASYALSTATTGQITGYQISPIDEFTSAPEKPYLVVLGTVLVPAAGTISQDSITDARRMEAWEQASPPEIIPRQLIRNSSFEMADTSKSQYSAWYWTRDTSSLATTSYWYISSSDPASGLFHLQLDYVGATGGVVSSMSQPIMAKVAGGDIFRLNMKLKALKTSTGGTLAVRLHFLNELGGVATGSPVTYTVPLSSIDSSYRVLSQTLTAPAGGAGGAAFLSHIEIRNSSLTASSDGPFVRIDDVELWFDKRNAHDQQRLDLEQHLVGALLALHPDPSRGDTTTFLTDVAKSLLMRVDPSTTEATVVAQRRDGGTSNYPRLDWKGRMKVGGGLGGGLLPYLETPYDDVAAGVTPVTALLDVSPADGSGVHVRMYVHQNGEIFFTTNASPTSATTLTWQKDVSGKPAWKWVLGSTTTATWPRLELRDASSNATWLDTSWTQYWRPYPSGPSSEQITNFTVDNSSGVWKVNTTAGAINGTLPPPADNANRTIIFKDVSGKFSTNPLTVIRNGAERIEGLSSNLVCNADYQEVRLYSDGTDWWLV